MGTQTNKELYSNVPINILIEEEEHVRLFACNSNPETSLLAHKLSARSKVLKKIFESDKNIETITLSDLKHEELEAFVRFIYSDGSVLSPKAKKHVLALYRAADTYEIPRLRDLCRETIVASLDSSNALKALEFAQIPFDKALTDAALGVIKTNGSSIVNSTEFKAFVVNHPNLALEIMKAISG